MQREDYRECDECDISDAEIAGAHRADVADEHGPEGGGSRCGHNIGDLQ
jgi:hypothetical protein